MDTKERLELITQWHYRMDDVDRQIKALESMFGYGVADSRFVETIEYMMQEYTDTLSKLIDDHTEMLSWYMYDNENGKKKLKVKCRNGKKLKVSNLEELAVAISYNNIVDPA